MSIGKLIEEKKHTVKLTQLARNKRKKADKNTGRKKPRKLDYDVTPAADSRLADLSNCSQRTEASKCNITTGIVEILGQCSPTKYILKTPTTKCAKKM